MTAQDSTGHPRRWWILGALCLSLIVVGLDVTVLNVALTRIATALSASTTQLQWIVNSYLPGRISATRTPQTIRDSATRAAR